MPPTNGQTIAAELSPEIAAFNRESIELIEALNAEVVFAKDVAKDAADTAREKRKRYEALLCEMTQLIRNRRTGLEEIVAGQQFMPFMTPGAKPHVEPAPEPEGEVIEVPAQPAVAGRNRLALESPVIPMRGPGTDGASPRKRRWLVRHVNASDPGFYADAGAVEAVEIDAALEMARVAFPAPEGCLLEVAPDEPKKSRGPRRRKAAAQEVE